MDIGSSGSGTKGESIMEILAFSDLHGDAPTLRLLKERVKDEGFDYILVAGDLTNADLIRPDERVRQVKEIFSIMEEFKIPYYYVWGTPFREGSISFAMQNYEAKEHEGKVVLERKSGSWNETIEMPKTGWKLFQEIEHFLSSLNFGHHVREEEPVRLGKYILTSSPHKVSRKTIFIQHHFRKIVQKAVVQVDGHVHYGQRLLNYLNLGFLYRDKSHGASPMVGCYWKLSLKGDTATISFVNLGEELKDYQCPNHPDEGVFYIPRYWKKCPICYNPKEAIATKGMPA